ncbi:MAG: two-component system, cell cycle sensor histidine kinase and response regulator CckA [Gaiellaceae bacterium]|jgi:signal transduction histidine kinase|nr:two-component system, cell cycle sensor histidine kinase and response regulator CckA [Gaiellaceae bacterium]
MRAWASQLEAPEELVGALLDGLHAVISVKDTDGRYLIVNKGWTDLHRVHADSVLGRTDAEVFGAGRPTRLALGDETLEESVQTVEVDGEERIFATRTYPLHDAAGELIAICSRSIDVTRQQREEGLRHGSNEVLELVATGAPLEEVLEAVATLIEAQSPGLLASVLRLDDEGLRVKHCAGPSLPREYMDAIDGELIGPQAGSCGTAAYRREQVIVEDIMEDPLWDPYRSIAARFGLRACWSTPIFASDGSVLGTFAMYYLEPRLPEPEELRLAEIATHIAGIAIERHKSEETLRRSEQELRQAHKMEAVGRLAGGIAHDFNNLLTAIGGYTELLIDKLPPEQRDDAEQIRHATDRAAALTKQLLAFTRRQVVQRESLDLNDVVRDMDRLLRRLIGVDIELVSVLAPEPARVEGDRSQLEQVIVNLVLNARDAMPAGGKLVIATAREEEWVQLRVEDSGVGIEDGVRPHIFEPFFTTKDPGRGTGLGLATVLGIVEQSEGRVELESAPGEGSTFTILLPASEGAGEAPAQALHPAEAHSLLGTETVLVVEDEEVIRTLVARTLREQGYRVLEARYGSEALELWEEHRDDIGLLVTDIVMPGMSGVELARRVAEERPELRILLMSGFAEPAAGEQVSAPSGAGFLEKPFTPSELVRRVREALA